MAWNYLQFYEYLVTSNELTGYKKSGGEMHFEVVKRQNQSAIVA